MIFTQLSTEFACLETVTGNIKGSKSEQTHAPFFLRYLHSNSGGKHHQNRKKSASNSNRLYQQNLV